MERMGVVDPVLLGGLSSNTSLGDRLIEDTGVVAQATQHHSVNKTVL